MKAVLVKAGRHLLPLVVIVPGLIYLWHPFPTAMEMGQDAKIKADIAAISQSLAAYEDMNGLLPTTAQGLSVLTTKPADYPPSKQWYQLTKQLPVDPWYNAYRCEKPGRHHPQSFDLYTTGGPRGKVTGNW